MAAINLSNLQPASFQSSSGPTLTVDALEPVCFKNLRALMPVCFQATGALVPAYLKVAELKVLAKMYARSPIDLNTVKFQLRRFCLLDATCFPKFIELFRRCSNSEVGFYDMIDLIQKAGMSSESETVREKFIFFKGYDALQDQAQELRRSIKDDQWCLDDTSFNGPKVVCIDEVEADLASNKEQLAKITTELEQMKEAIDKIFS